MLTVLLKLIGDSHFLVDLFLELLKTEYLNKLKLLFRVSIKIYRKITDLYFNSNILLLFGFFGSGGLFNICIH